MMRGMRLTKDQERTLQQWAEAAVPNECCGALLGDGADVTELVLLENVASTPRVAFEVSAKSYLQVEARAEATGVKVLGFFHSHVDASAVPSAVDTAMAHETFAMVITSVRGGVADVPRVFILGRR